MSSEGELIFGARCEDKKIKSGYNMPLNQDVKIVVTYDGVSAKFYVDN
jgi:hypothetical protein